MDIKRMAPKHIIEYCCVDDTDVTFLKLYEKFHSEYSFVYKVRCICGNDKLVVYKDKHPSIYAQCDKCENMITIYDLDYYPAATKITARHIMDRVDENPVCVYVNYEYDDEFLYEEDVEFDLDDITWGRVFVSYGDKLIQILDDETA